MSQLVTERTGPVVVTGGAGFIGSHVTRRLVYEGRSVVVIDNFFRGTRENIAEAVETGLVEVVKMDLADNGSVPALVELLLRTKPTQILHYAAINGTEYFYDRPIEVFETNYGVTAVLMRALQEAAQQGVRPYLMYASTSEVYGDPPVIPTPESAPALIRSTEDRDSYAAGKLMGELSLRLYAERIGLPWMILRIFNVYGPRMVSTKYGQVIPELIYRAKEGEYPLKLIGDGSQTRSFCYIDDHVELTLQLIAKGVSERIVNLGNDEEVTIRGVAELVLESLGKEPKLEFSAPRSGDHSRRRPDISELRRQVGEYRFLSVAEGIQKLV